MDSERQTTPSMSTDTQTVKLDAGDRLQPPPNDDCFQVQSIEISFAIPCWMTFEDQDRFGDAVEHMVSRPCNQLKNGVHWQAGTGAKPQWSRADCEMLGKTPHSGAPETGEPTFDDSVFYIETSARGFVSEDERAKNEKRRAKGEPPNLRQPLERANSTLTDTIDLMRDEFLRIKACPNVSEEVVGLCERATSKITQRVPVLVQRDTAEKDRARLVSALNGLMEAVNEDVGTISAISPRCEAAWKQARAAIKLATESK